MSESAKLVKPSPIEIPEDSPFANDQLDRKPDAELLGNIIANTEHSIVISIDAPWGAGKTTFVQMWQQMLRQRGHPTVYFNAWATDYVEDPLIAFIGEHRLRQHVIRQTRRSSSAGIACETSEPGSSGLQGHWRFALLRRAS